MTRGEPVPGYRVTDDSAAMDVEAIHAFLTDCYWAKGVSREVVEGSIRGSLVCVGVFDSHGAQVGFARAVSDGATFAWIADVYVLERHRGRGLAAWLLTVLLAHPNLQGLRRTVLATRDAHGLYGAFGFLPLVAPERWMERAARPKG